MKRSNPFYDYIKTLWSIAWGKVVISIFGIAATGILQWGIKMIIENNDTSPKWLTLENVSLVFNIVISTIALWFIMMYKRHFSSEHFKLALEGDAPNVILTLPKGSRGNQILEHAIYKQGKVALLFIILCACLILMYFVFLFDKNIYLIFDKEIIEQVWFSWVRFASLIFKILINSYAIYTLINLYYAFTYSDIDKEMISKRLLGWRFGIFIISIALCIFIFVKVFSEGYESYSDILTIVGIITGVSFALFFGKLDGPLIGTPTPILWIAYSYSVLQATFFLFDSSATSLAPYYVWALYFATVFKCVILIYLFWLLRKDRIIIYSIFHWTTYYNTEAERKKIEEILESLEIAVENRYTSNNP